jgi:hypothetical protein
MRLYHNGRRRFNRRVSCRHCFSRTSEGSDHKDAGVPLLNHLGKLFDLGVHDIVDLQAFVQDRHVKTITQEIIDAQQ